MSKIQAIQDLYTNKIITSSEVSWLLGFPESVTASKNSRVKKIDKALFRMFDAGEYIPQGKIIQTAEAARRSTKFERYYRLEGDTESAYLVVKYRCYLTNFYNPL